MSKLVNIIGGVGLGLSLSQFPEYSQQYVQRLGGAVDELNIVVKDFDATAKRTNQSREEALASMQGTEFLEGRQSDMTRTINRHENLNDSYNVLRNAGAFERLAYVNRFGDGQITSRAWEDFQPAVPLSIEALGLLFGGYVFGYGALSGTGRIGRLFRRRKKSEYT